MSENTVELSFEDKSKATVHLHGATITSFQVEGEEILFVSEKSVFDNKKAIRGGIPVVFPNFGPWSLGPQHGFARTKRWTVKKSLAKSELILSLTDDEETRKVWDFKFELEYVLTLSANSLKTELVIHNNDDKQFDFTSLLHTYIKLDDINNAKVSDLTNCVYVDKVNNGVVSKETSDLVQINGETDRVYYSTGKEHTIITGNANKYNVVIKKENFPDTVVWNPWIDKAKGMTDFGDEEYKRMICVEAGHIQGRYVLPAKGVVKMGQEIFVKSI